MTTKRTTKPPRIEWNGTPPPVIIHIDAELLRVAVTKK